MQNTLAAEPVHARVETLAPDFERLPPQQYVLQRFLFENQNVRPEFWRRVEIQRPLHGWIWGMLVLGRCLMPMASMQTERKCDARMHIT